MNEILEFIGRTADGVCAIDGQQRIAHWNDAARDLLGYTAPEVRGRHCYSVLGGSDEADCRVCRSGCAAMRTARRMEIVATRDLRIRSKSGRQLWISVSTVSGPARWSPRIALVHLFRDVSRHKQLERELRRIVGDAIGPLPGPGAGSPGPTSAETTLTQREQEVLRLLASGTPTLEIARRLAISPATVRNHVHHILDKFGVHSRLEAVARALRCGLL